MGDVFIEVLVKRNRKATDTLMKTLLIAFVVVLFAGGILFIPLLLPLGLIVGMVEWFFILPRFDVEYEYRENILNLSTWILLSASRSMDLMSWTASSMILRWWIIQRLTRKENRMSACRRRRDG